MSAPVRAVRRPWFLPTLAGYQAGWIGNDIVAGLSAGAVVIPQAMAYATIANLPVQAGLYTCMVPMLVYALLGGSRAMSVSTTSTIATLTATTAVSAGVAGNSTDIPRDIITLTLLVGVILAIARLLKLGSLVEIINRPTIIGIQVGVGATVAVGQLPKLLGETGNETGHGFIRSIHAAISAISDGNLTTVLLSAGSITALFLLKRFLPAIPGPLVVVAIGIALGATTWLTDAGVDLIAPVPSGLPSPELPDLTKTLSLLPGALAIAAMAFLESAAVARGIRKQGEPAVDADQELFATSAANIVGSFFQILPAAGGFSQSAVNQNAGARSQLSSIVTVALAVLVGLFFGPLLSLLPQATLAALVFVAVVGLIDIKAMLRLWRVQHLEFWIAAATAVVGLSIGLLAAVLVGVLLTIVLVLRALNRPRIRVEIDHGDRIAVRLLSPLYTANVLATQQAVLAVAAEHEGLDIVVLDMSVIEDTTTTVLDTIAELDHELAGDGVQLRIAALPDASAVIARRTAWFSGLEAAGRVFPDAQLALL